MQYISQRPQLPLLCLRRIIRSRSRETKSRHIRKICVIEQPRVDLVDHSIACDHRRRFHIVFWNIVRIGKIIHCSRRNIGQRRLGSRLKPAIDRFMKHPISPTDYDSIKFASDLLDPLHTIIFPFGRVYLDTIIRIRKYLDDLRQLSANAAIPRFWIIDKKKFFHKRNYIEKNETKKEGNNEKRFLQNQIIILTFVRDQN